uniref:Uncharacterized protein n=1 Tax=Pithovirus LCPAC104 TaxID=2506589 RepID=A0A481Z404_9VIRU|nr:MAG: hypothetical protein LCPAC104_00800 [Pithovirus LCPAC104]
MVSIKRISKAIEKIPNPSFDISEDFISETRKNIKNIFNDVTSCGKEDDRKFEKEYDLLKNQKEIPKVIWILAKYGHNELKIPYKSYCLVRVGLYMRKSRMMIPPPSKMTLCRIILNYDYDEIYSLQEIKPTNTEKKEWKTYKELMIKKNTANILGPGNLSNYQIYIGSNPFITIKSENLDNPQANTRKTIRHSNYERITVILDYRCDEIKISKLLDIIDTGEIDMNDDSLKELAEKLLGSRGFKIPNKKSIEGLFPKKVKKDTKIETIDLDIENILNN